MAEPDKHESIAALEKGIARTDRAAQFFAIISGLSAALSAGAAVYTVIQMKGTNEQTERAISKISDLSANSRLQNDLMKEELSLLNIQAHSTKNLIRPTTMQANSENESLIIQRNNLDIQEKHFENSERPIMDMNSLPASLPSKPFVDQKSKVYGWNFGLKNVGKTTAKNIIIDKGLSINGSPFYRIKLKSNMEYIPGTQMFATAAIPFDNSPKVQEIETATYIIRVRITYSDELGHSYINEYCRRYIPGSAVGSCSFSDVDRLGFVDLQLH